MLACHLLLLALAALTTAELPTELDPFLELLFDKEECEDFISSGEFTAVATVECNAFKCDFPRQLCMRPAAKYQDPSSSVCKTLPDECATAANGGVPLGPPVRPMFKTLPPIIQPELVTIEPTRPAPVAPPPAPKRVVDPHEICYMDAPTGRFCGFKLQYVYNKETYSCDEFWFPGCRTAETNANLFDSHQQCQQIADICKPAPTTTRRPRTRTMPPHAKIRPGAGFGGHAGAGAQGPPPPNLGPAGGIIGNSGNGNDGDSFGNNIFGLITQGIMGAQQLKPGGAKGPAGGGPGGAQWVQQLGSITDILQRTIG